MKLEWRQVAAAFLIGLIAGTAIGRWGLRFRSHKHWGSEKHYSRMLKRFSSKLDLTPEQRKQVATILDAKREKIKALHSEIRPEFEEIRTSTKAEIRRLLTPEQQEKFDQLQSKWESHWKKYRHGHGGKKHHHKQKK